MWRAFKVAQARQREEIIEWEVRRRMLAELLGKPVGRIDVWDLILCRARHGVPNEPRPALRMDRRYGPRLPNLRKPPAPETVKR